MKHRYVKNLLFTAIFFTAGFQLNPLQASVFDFLWGKNQEEENQKKWNQKKKIEEFTNKDSATVNHEFAQAIKANNVAKVLGLLNLNRWFLKITNADELLHEAIEDGNLLMVSALAGARYRNNGRDIPICNVNSIKKGLTPIMLALLKGQIKVANLLAQEGADIYHGTPNGTILSFAIKAGNPELIATILDRIDNESNNFVRNSKKIFAHIDKNGNTIFNLACEEFLKNNISPFLFTRILQYHQEYNFQSPQTEVLLKNIDLILKQIEADKSKFFNFPFRMYFNIDPEVKYEIAILLSKMQKWIVSQPKIKNYTSIFD